MDYIYVLIFTVIEGDGHSHTCIACFKWGMTIQFALLRCHKPKVPKRGAWNEPAVEINLRLYKWHWQSALLSTHTKSPNSN